MGEQDVRVSAINSIMTTPHRTIEPLIPIHNDAINGDPLFYVKMAIWYQKNGSVRDHSKVFASRILTCEYPEFRPVGEKLLGMMSVRDTADSIFSIANKFYKGKTGGKYRRIRKTVGNIVKRMEKISVETDGVQMLRNAKILHSLIAHFRVPITDTTSASLKFSKHPEDTQKLKAFEALDIISKGGESEKKICTLIDKYRLPPTQVMGAIKELTPAIAASMLKGMSQAETVIFMKMFEKKGLTKNPEFTKLIQRKLTSGPKNKTSSSLRSIKAAQSLSQGDGAKVMAAVTDDFVASLKRIKKKVLLAIDKSGSMQEAITVGKEVATILAATIDNPTENLGVVVFDKIAAKVDVAGDTTYTGFENKFRYIKANGTTSLGSVIDYIDKSGFIPDVVVFITDGDECATPVLNTALSKSNNVFNLKLINCKVGKKTYNLNVKKDVIDAKSLDIEDIEYKGDYYSLPNLVNIISSGGIMDTVEEIMSINIDTFLNTESK